MKMTPEEVRKTEARYISKSQKIPYFDMVFERGEGPLLYDSEGKEYIDLLSSASSAILGHGNQEVADAVARQIRQLGQYTIAYVYMEKPVLLAKKLAGLAPGDRDKKVAFGLSGSDSIDGAIKYARGYTKRHKLISFQGSYHGSTYGACSLSALSLNMTRSLELLPDIHHFTYPACFRCKYGKKCQSCDLQCLGELEEAFETYLPPEEVAAVFLEPIAGDAGLLIPPKRYVQALYALCKKQGILFVVDEIQQGMGRTGNWFAIEQFGVEPDLLVAGKALGGGLPMGAVIGRAEILDCLEPPAHLFTMGGNAAVAAAALKTIEIIERDGLLSHAEKMGDYFKEKLEELASRYDVIGDVRGMGLSIAMDLVKSRTSMEPDRQAALKVSYTCVQNGVFLIFLGKNSLRIQPPLVITKEQIDRALDVLEDAVIKLICGQIDDSVSDLVKGW